MVMHAMFVDMCFGIMAWVKLEEVEIEIFDHFGLNHFVAALACMGDTGHHLTFFFEF